MGKDDSIDPGAGFGVTVSRIDDARPQCVKPVNADLNYPVLGDMAWQDAHRRHHLAWRNSARVGKLTSLIVEVILGCQRLRERAGGNGTWISGSASA